MKNLIKTKGESVMPTTQVKTTKVKKPFETATKRDKDGKLTAVSGKNFKSKS